MIIIEEPPAIRTVRIDRSFGDEFDEIKLNGLLEEYGMAETLQKEMDRRNKQFTLAFPYILHFILIMRKLQFSYGGGKVFFRPAPLMGMGDELFLANITNINSDNNLCLGDGSFPRTTLPAAVSAYLDKFWLNSFNSDYNYWPVKYRREGVPFMKNIFEWEHQSKIDPSFIYRINFIRDEKDKTFGVALRRAFSDFGLKKDADRDPMSTIMSVITTPFDSSETPDTAHVQKYIENVAYSASLDRYGRYTMNLGDRVTLKDEEYTVATFLSQNEIGMPSHVRLIKNDGTPLMQKLTPAIKAALMEDLKARTEKEYFMLGRTKIRQDDIVKFERGPTTFYRKVRRIREFDGKLEVQLGGDYFMLDYIKESIKKFRVDKPELRGTILKKGENYLISHGGRRSSPICIFKNLVYDHIDVAADGNIVYVFVVAGTIGLRENINTGNTRQINILNETEFEDITGQPFVIYNKIYSLRERSENVRLFRSENRFWHTAGSNLNKPSLDDLKRMVNDNKFSVATIGSDIEYEVGDNVVVADWREPLEMLRVKRLAGFKFDEENVTLSFILQDKDGKMSSHVMVDAKHGNFAINTVRKITNEYKGVTSGTKIRATEAGIANFPKKDTNIIIGFLYDTHGEIPLVLCSNGLTLWADYMLENFEFIKMGTEDWDKLEHAPLDMKKITLQPGDMFEIPNAGEGPDMVYLICGDARGSSDECLSLTDPLRSEVLIFDDMFKSYSLPYGFLTPRYTRPQLKRKSVMRGFPNGHGMFVKNEDVTRFSYPVDKRRILNV
jgi:hypothetical protein